MVLFQGEFIGPFWNFQFQLVYEAKLSLPTDKCILGFWGVSDETRWARADDNPFALVLLGAPVRSHVPFLRAFSSLKSLLSIGWVPPHSVDRSSNWRSSNERFKFWERSRVTFSSEPGRVHDVLLRWCVKRLEQRLSLCCCFFEDMFGCKPPR